MFPLVVYSLSVVVIMPLPGVVPRSAEEIEKVRRAYVERDNRPTYAELSEEFGIPVSSIGHYSSSDSWAELRAAYLDKKGLEGDALSLITQAASRVDRRVMQMFSDVVLVGLQKLSYALSRIPEEQASSTQVQTVSTASFAFKNFADGCKAVGIISFGKELAALGKEDNGRWNPQMLSQINLTVQNLVSQAGGKPIDPPAAASVVAPSGPEKPGPIAGKNSERDE